MSEFSDIRPGMKLLVRYPATVMDQDAGTGLSTLVTAVKYMPRARAGRREGTPAGVWLVAKLGQKPVRIGRQSFIRIVVR
jgi:hypothetical protein